MPIAALKWESNPGRDFDASRDRHILRTQTSGSLLEEGNLQYVLEDGGEQTAGEYPFADVEIEFRPLFRAQKALERFSGFGIHVDARTGIISFDPGPRNASAPRNFLLQVSVLTNTGGKRSPAQILPLLLRIHIHESVRQIWLTPETMTIHPSQLGIADDVLYRFTAVAEFDDDTVGDITAHHGLTWSTPGTAAPQIDPDGFLTVISSDVVGTIIPVVATTSAPWGLKTGSAKAVVAAPWSAGPSLAATLVEGPPSAWMTVAMQADLSANVLLLGIGFPDEDNDAFETLIAAACRQIKRDLITRPYDVLSDSINFWRARAPAKTRGVNVRSEVVVAGAAATRALNVTPATRPPGNGPWDVSHVMFAAGLPMPADFGREVVDIRDDFAKRVDAQWALAVNDETSLTGDTIREWRLQGKRMLVDAIDGFFPVVVGVPPSVQSDEPLAFMYYPSGYRGTDRHLDAFLTSIVADNGATVSGGRPLGTVWSSAGFTFDNRRLVVMIGATAQGRANFPGKVLMSMGQEGYWNVEPVLGRKAVRLKVLAIDLPFLDSRTLWRVTAHELGHAFNLGDEYAFSAATFTEPDPFGIEFEKWSNVLSLASVLKPADAGAPPPPPGTSKISGELIKWRWPRIRHAAVITDPPTEVAGDFVYPLAPRHGFQFSATDPLTGKVGTKVRLRARTPGEPLRRFTTNIVPSGSPFVEVSDSEFIVDAISPAGDSVTLRKISGDETQVTLNRFKAGSLIFEPVVPSAAFTPAEYPFAEILTIGVRKWITARGASDPIFECNPDLEFLFPGKLQLPDFDAFPFTFSPRNNARLIGLYKSGGGFACGTYHPAGLCMMRQDTGFDEFCAVCRYALVDFIDPTGHADIEKDLGERNFE
jgi:hypothetical protein